MPHCVLIECFQEPEAWNGEPTPINALVNLLSQISEVMAQTNQFKFIERGTILASYERAIHQMKPLVSDQEGPTLIVGVGSCVPSLLAAKILTESEVGHNSRQLLWLLRAYCR